MSNASSIEPLLGGFQEDFDTLRREIAKVVVGNADVIEGVLIAAVAGGHVLLEGVPGLGKTLLVETLADVVRLTFQRIQFTPDLMPSDLIGTYVVMENAQGRRVFDFQQGPIFANLILADQINRGVPKTQAALLQAMEGESISVAHETFKLPQPFFVMATQNPLEMEGTFPLPEPEIDRFLLKLVVAPPTCEQIEEIVERTTQAEPAEIRVITDGQRLLEMRKIARAVSLPAPLRHWAVGLVAATQPDSPQAPEMVRRCVRYGSSPRGAQALVMAAKVRAAAAGRADVSQADLGASLHAALRHRIMLNFEGLAENVAPDRLIDDILAAAGGAKA
jgi:MoxR-like ATPase